MKQLKTLQAELMAKLGYEFEGRLVDIATRLPRQLGRPRGGRSGYRYSAGLRFGKFAIASLPQRLSASNQQLPYQRSGSLGRTEDQLLERRQGPPVPFLE
jgi:hypothetical protein